jgi:hypothetical protein
MWGNLFIPHMGWDTPSFLCVYVFAEEIICKDQSRVLDIYYKSLVLGSRNQVISRVFGRMH